MLPTTNKFTNELLGPPKDWNNENGNCIPLPVCRMNGNTYSYWRVSWRERLAIIFGKNVRLIIHGEIVTPLALDTEI